MLISLVPGTCDFFHRSNLKLQAISLCLILYVSSTAFGSTRKESNNKSISKPSDTEPLQTESFTLTFSLPLPLSDEPINDTNVVVSLKDFVQCEEKECKTICGEKDEAGSHCDLKNPKLCMCNGDNFDTSNLDGTVSPVNNTNEQFRNCSVACNKRKSYARVYSKNTPVVGLHCICLMGQVTPTGITLCDEFAVEDICTSICQTDTAICAFNGVCLCRSNWEFASELSLQYVRHEVPEDNEECLTRCKDYHHDYVGRMFDMKIGSLPSLPSSSGGHPPNGNASKPYEFKFREKFCICGPWIGSTKAETKAIVSQGFQICTGLKCKIRCGMDEATCEFPHRRACLCYREGIVIGKHLWSRLPTPQESRCHEACSTYGLDARVIEWNPRFVLQNEWFTPTYKKSQFQYLYDGKFCHCVQAQMDMHQYRPCTDEICKMICGHHEAQCDQRSRRACFCNTHKLPLGLGRRPDPAEVNCNIACRYGLFDALIIDLTWEVPAESWSVKLAKYCVCVRPISPAGLTHCDPFEDDCPKFCKNKNAYCTREKYCFCGDSHDLQSSSPMVRRGNSKEEDECGQNCHSWMWPIAEDTDTQPFIYDERLQNCRNSKACLGFETIPSIDQNTDALESNNEMYRRFCLCVKSKSIDQSPGTRILPHLTPHRMDVQRVPCVTNHSCMIVRSGIHIIS